MRVLQRSTIKPILCRFCSRSVEAFRLVVCIQRRHRRRCLCADTTSKIKLHPSSFSYLFYVPKLFSFLRIFHCFTFATFIVLSHSLDSLAPPLNPLFGGISSPPSCPLLFSQSTTFAHLSRLKASEFLVSSENGQMPLRRKKTTC